MSENSRGVLSTSTRRTSRSAGVIIVDSSERYRRESTDKNNFGQSEESSIDDNVNIAGDRTLSEDFTRCQILKKRQPKKATKNGKWEIN